MECSNIHEKFSEYIDDALSSEEKRLVDEHLKSCEKCRQELSGLSKAAEHIRNLEEIEPPDWLEKKIMARVREEAETGKGLLKKLFYPLHIKLPVEAFAMIAVAVITVYIFKTMPEEIKETRYAGSRSESFAPELSMQGEDITLKDTGGREIYDSKSSALQKNAAPAPLGGQYRKSPSPEKKGNSSKIEEQTFSLKPAEKPSPAGKLAAPESRHYSEYEIARESQQKERLKHKEPTAPAPSPSYDKITEVAGSLRTEEAKQEGLTSSYRAKAISLPEKVRINLTVSTNEISASIDDIKGLVIRLGGKIDYGEAVVDKNTVMAKLPSGQLNELIKKLGSIGEVRDIPESLQHREGIIKVSIEVTGTDG